MAIAEGRLGTATGPATARAGFAGAGSGTGLVVFAESLPDGAARTISLYLAPAASVLLGALALYVEIQARRYMQHRLVRRLRRTLEEYLRNPHTSDEHKLLLRQRLEQIEEVVTSQEVERIRLIGVVASDSSAHRRS
jgi:hypothetical protein